MSKRKRRGASEGKRKGKGEMPARPADASAGPEGSRESEAAEGWHRWLSWLILFGIVLAIFLVRWRLLDVPMERDEGEYAYGGQLILRGIPIYDGMYTLKLPGIHLCYAVVLLLFGETLRGAHLGLLAVSCLSAVLTYKLGRRLFGPVAGLTAAAALGVLSVSPSVQGAQANAEHFVLPVAVGGMLLLAKSLDEDRRWLLALAGVLLGTSFIIKQHAAMYCLASGVIVAWHYGSRMQWGKMVVRGLVLLAGGVTPFLLTVAVIRAQGQEVFDSFWFWTFTYARAYTSLAQRNTGWRMLWFYGGKVWWSAPAVWLLAAVGLTALGWSPAGRRRWYIALPYVALSAAAVSIGLYFRPHYFVLLLPAAALMVGLAAQAGFDALSRARSRQVAASIVATMVVACVGVSVGLQWDYLFVWNPNEVSRQTYRLEAFPEAVTAGQLLAEHTRPTDRIGLVCSDPQLLFYANRLSASPYMYLYPMQEKHEFRFEMRQRFIDDLNEAKPKYLVMTQFSRVWFYRTVHAKRPHDFEKMGDWWREFSKDYMVVGLVIRDRDGGHQLGWDETGRLEEPEDRALQARVRRIVILKRRSAIVGTP